MNTSGMDKEIVRNLVLKQKNGSSAIWKNIEILTFLSAVLKLAGKNDNAIMSYPEISGLGVLLERVKNDLAENGANELPFSFQLEELAGLKMGAENEKG